MADFNKYIYSKGTHYISNSGHDENGKYKNGTAGDQKGDEWALRSWYNRPWSCVLRWPDQKVAQKFAELGILAPLNDKIGYDQYQRKTYWTQLEKAGYDPSKITTACEEDCTAGVTANCKAVGYLLGIEKLKNLQIDTYSGNMKSRFKSAGFTVLTDKKYLTSGDYLLPGDVLLYVDHHAAMNITLGKKAPAWNPDSEDVPEKEPEVIYPVSVMINGGSVNVREEPNTKTGRIISVVHYGDVLEYVGESSENGWLKVKLKSGSTGWVSGKYADLNEIRVCVTGGSVNVRSAPNTKGSILGTAHKGDKFVYQGEVSPEGWLLIIYKNQNAWISPKYSELANV